MLAGHVGGCKRSLSSMFEAVGQYTAGAINDEQLDEFEKKVCPTCGSCSGMYTANSMNCLTEAIGMGLPGNGTIPAVYSERIMLAKKAGYAVMDMYNKGITARRDYDKGRNPECTYSRYGTGLFNKLNASPASNCS